MIQGERKYRIFLNAFYPLLAVDFILGLISLLKTGSAVLPFDGLVFISIVGIVITGNGVEHITSRVGLNITQPKNKED